MYNSKLPIGYTTEQLPLAPFSPARARDFVRDANAALEDEPLDFGPEYNEDVAMALISRYLEHHRTHPDMPKLLGNIALDYLCLMPPQRINNRYGLHRWGKSQLQSTARDVAKEAALLINVDTENVEAIQEEVASETPFLHVVDLKETIQSLYDNSLLTPEVYVGMLILTEEKKVPENVAARAAAFVRMARGALRTQALRFKPDDAEYPRYLMPLLMGDTDGGNTTTLSKIVEQFRRQSKISDSESAERIYKRLIGAELLQLYSLPTPRRNTTDTQP